MHCTICDLTWDMNDHVPPTCMKGKIDMKTVSIKFTPYGQPYTYKTDLDLADGDTVVVNTPNSGLQLVKVHEVHDTPQLDEGFDYAWIVQKIDLTNYRKLLKEDEDANPVRTRL